ncbi:MAG: 2Fe-2S iron-sulfur cluster-binding protein [Bacillota bacterium]|nr:2Fe-2S iron-sulfur cluster-binding protein [Bacillota bacterium]
MESVFINGCQVEIRAGETVLETARRSGFQIPSLCYHEGLGAYGGCRLCLVEVEEGKNRFLAASCTLPARAGLRILTESQPVQKARAQVIALLLARCGNLPVLHDLAERCGVPQDLYPRLVEDECILCGLCVRACEAVGGRALSFTWRGIKRKVSPPFEKPSEECLGCRACAHVCPTGAIKVEEGPVSFTLLRWKTEHTYVRCRSCGRPFAPLRFTENFGTILEGGAGVSSGTGAGTAAVAGALAGELCPACRRSLRARELSRTAAKR